MVEYVAIILQKNLIFIEFSQFFDDCVKKHMNGVKKNAIKFCINPLLPILALNFHRIRFNG